MLDFIFQDEFTRNFRGNIKANEPCGPHTTMKTGGVTPAFLEPFDADSMIYAINEFLDRCQKFFVLGGGSNTILPDEMDFPIISTRKLECGISYDPENSSVEICAGTSWGQVIAFCREHQLSGIEEFTGLSGSAGGAAFMNATCFGLSLSDLLLSARYIDYSQGRCNLKDYSMLKDQWSYKKSPFQKGNLLVLSLTLKVSAGHFDQEKSAAVLEKRKAAGHFLAPSAGSVFKNNAEKGIIAGKIIDECGLKGISSGGAQVAPWHGNFIINPDRKATSKDIRQLVDLIQKQVKIKTGVDLECEILFI